MEAADLGHRLVLEGVPPESALEMHFTAQDTLLNELSPDTQLNALIQARVLALEVMMAHGLAHRKQQEERLTAEASQKQLEVQVEEQAHQLVQERELQQVNQELAVLEERTRVAREIHDTVAQTLTVLVNQLDSIEHLIPTEQQDILNQILEASDLAQACLAQTRSAILDLQPIELKPGGLSDGIEAEAANFRERGLPVQVKFQGTEPLDATEGSTLAVYRIIQEALSNCYKHSNASTVGVEIIFGPSDVVLHIVDDGVGFDVRAQRAERRVGLTGFGLGVMDQRATLAGGELTIVSARGAGTRIISRIPLSTPDATVMPIEPEETIAEETAEAGTCRILLVDDHELIRQGIRAWLDMTDDIDVVGEADTGEWAIVKALELQPDVILMDVNMPVMDGIHVTKELSESLPECKVILLTIYQDDDHIRDGIRAGAKGYMVKGAGREEVLSGIRTVFAGGSLVPSSLIGNLASGPKIDPRPDITSREREVLNLLANGAPTKEIAAALIVSENTVNFHLRHLYQKLGVKSRTQAVREGRNLGLLGQTN